MKYFLLVIIILLILSYSLIGQTKPKLTMEQAKEKAELFVEEQGYTNLPPTNDTLKVIRELFDNSSISETLKYRHNMLEANAIGVKVNKSGWIVAFRYSSTNKFFKKTKFDFKRYGRAITLDAFGEKMRIEHKDIILNVFQK
ncbi:MAG: hypothetical protein WAO19_14130 [Candidatus Kryptoniota bacterium]